MKEKGIVKKKPRLTNCEGCKAMTYNANNLPGFSAEAVLHPPPAHLRKGAARKSDRAVITQVAPALGDARRPARTEVRALAGANPCDVLATCCAQGNLACCQAWYNLCLCLPLQNCCAAGNPACCRAYWKACVCPDLRACCAGGNWLCCAIGRLTC